MEHQQPDRENVEGRDNRLPEPIHHHRVYIVAIERIWTEVGESRVGYNECEMGEMVENEREHDQAAQPHVTRSESRFDVVLLGVIAPRAPVIDRQYYRVVNVQ